METSSRIFVKGLPPAFTDSDFKKHFAFQGREITETRLFPNRRIGYVGYKTSDDAQKAVKYFNKSFVRMSRIGVEIARPPSTGKTPTSLKDASQDVHNSEKSGTAQNSGETAPENPKLQEFLAVMKPASKKRAWDHEADDEQVQQEEEIKLSEGLEDKDDSEYEELVTRSKRQKRVDSTTTKSKVTIDEVQEEVPLKASTGVREEADPSAEAEADTTPRPVSDSDWARSKTSRLLGLVDDDDNDGNDVATTQIEKSGHDSASSEYEAVQEPSPEAAELAQPQKAEPGDALAAVDAVRASMRLFLRNLSYNVKAQDLESEFLQYGNIEEVHVSMSKKTGLGKGFAYIQFADPDSAEQAFLDKDGQIFQGRLLHILPASAKRETQLNDFDLSKLPLKKQQQIQRRRNAASTQFNWNTLYMNPDAVISSVASQLGISKSEILDPTSSDAAVKQAHAETHVIQETKSFFKSHGVDLDAFKRSQRGDTAILVKNIPHDASRDELKRLFEEQGEVKRLIMPPSGVIAIVEMSNAAQARSAFNVLAYKRLKSSMLFLEKAPVNLFSATPPKSVEKEEGLAKTSTTDLKMINTREEEQALPTTGTVTLFVRNLNFSTTSAQLSEAFEPLAGFMNARVKTRTDAKRPGEVLSMGFGFVEFRTAQSAQAALAAMDGFALHGHKLQVRASHKGVDAAEERRQADRAKREAAQSTKIIIKNLPFETSKKDVRSLFSAYGQLRSVRVPKKMDRAARGFAFAEFTTSKEAQSAMDALRDTHLLGRRLVLDFAAEDAVDAEEEIERMAAKVGGQANAVAVQRLTGQGRKKFTTRQNDDDDVN